MIYLGNLINSCGDYGLISILVILKRILSIMQIVVPIVLILSCIWGLTRMMINPDDKKGMIHLKNKVLAALIFIFIPYLVNLTLIWTDTNFQVGGCWATAYEYKAQLDSTSEYDVSTSIGNRKPVQYDIKQYKFGGGDSSSGGNNNIKGTAKGKEIVEYALKFVGKRYVYGGGHSSTVNLEKIYKNGGGVDCSGFTAGVYQHFGYNVSGSTFYQEKLGKEVSYKDAQAGDLILYSGHVAIFMGDGHKIVHASSSLPYPQGGIKITEDARYDTIKTVRRII